MQLNSQQQNPTFLHVGNLYLAFMAMWKSQIYCMLKEWLFCMGSFWVGKKVLKILCFFDKKKKKGCQIHHHHANELQIICNFIAKDWSFILCHIYREAKFTTDILAKMGVNYEYQVLNNCGESKNLYVADNCGCGQ